MGDARLNGVTSGHRDEYASQNRLSTASCGDEFSFLRIYVPDIDVQKCLQFPKDHLIGDIKAQLLAALPKELKQSFNYGLFSPPTENKTGRFLEEQRLLSDYQFSEPVAYLELRYKRRIYRTLKIDEKQFKVLHTRSNLRRFLEYVSHGQVEKITKMCGKGLDPNFHCVESGETPLSLATSLAKPSKVLMALINGGAVLDFRTLEGLTPIHRAVENNNLDAVVTLLELGASPNSKDLKSLTPLYISIIQKTDPLICERLLHERAAIGAQDLQGWQEIHQACRYGLLRHLEHLLLYGADTNARNASGNTPLHVCAVNAQEACARLLLCKGASSQSLNFSNQAPHQVAIIAGNLELANIILNYKAENSVSLSRYNSTFNFYQPSYPTNNSLFYPSVSPLPSTWTPRIILPELSIPSSPSPTYRENSSPTKLDDTVSYITEKSVGESSDSSGIGTANSDIMSSETTTKVSVAQDERYTYHRHSSQGNLRIDSPYGNCDDMLSSKKMNDKGLNNHYATAPRSTHRKGIRSGEKTVVLHKTKRGFGFILRGAKATSNLMDKQPTYLCPALQYLDDVDKGGVADLAGLRKGDFLLAINGEDVSFASHERVVQLIRTAGELVTMTVMSRSTSQQEDSNSDVHYVDPSSNISRFATLPHKLKNRRPPLGKVHAPLPPRRDPKTTLSVGRARSKSFAPDSGCWENGDNTNKGEGFECDSQQRTASIRSRPVSSRITTAELQELFQRQADITPMHQSSVARLSEPFVNNSSRVYASVAEMKQRKANAVKNNTSNSPTHQGKELRRNFHSVPDLVKVCQIKINDTTNLTRNHKSQEHIGSDVEGSSKVSASSRQGITKIENGRNVPPDVISSYIGVSGVNSSFNPNNDAVIYASSSDITATNNDLGRQQVRKGGSARSRTSVCDNYSTIQRKCYSTQPPSTAPPPIPDPDYSESDEEKDNRDKKKYNLTSFNEKKTVQLNPPLNQVINESTPPVKVIIRTHNEDGDNSSSGVSSDQEISTLSPSLHKTSTVQSDVTTDLNSSVTVSHLSSVIDLTGESVNKDVELMVLPPPPQFTCSNVELLDPPPQFSDST